MEITPIKIDDRVRVGQGLTLIAGPCVAESETLCLEIAGCLKDVACELDVRLVFKASFDKANRSSAKSFRGPGLDEGLDILRTVKRRYELPTLTDVHETAQIAAVAAVVDVIQIPAFLCRQTDLLQAAGATGKPVNVKKGQFMAPEDMKLAIDKVRDAGDGGVMLTERGTTFGYHNLVVDMRSLSVMRGFGVPVVFDATHSVQLPGGMGHASGGQRQFVKPLARAAAAVGVDALFLETHPDPDNALSDGPNSLNFKQLREVVAEVREIHEIAGKSSDR